MVAAPLQKEVPPRLELGSLDSKSKVLTITPWDRCVTSLESTESGETVMSMLQLTEAGYGGLRRAPADSRVGHTLRSRARASRGLPILPGVSTAGSARRPAESARELRAHPRAKKIYSPSLPLVSDRSKTMGQGPSGI